MPYIWSRRLDLLVVSGRVVPSPLPVGPWILGVDVPSRFEDYGGPIESQPSVRHGNPSPVPSEVWEFSQSCQWKIDDFLGSIERGRWAICWMTGVKFAICGHLLALEDFCELLPVPDYSIFQFPCSYFVGSTSGDLPISGTCEPLLGSSRCASKIPCASFHCVGDAGLTGLWRAWDCCLGVKKVRGKNEALTIFHRIHVSFTYMYHINRPNVGKYYTLPMGSYGWLQTHHENGSPFYSLTSWTNRPCVKVNAEGPAQVGSWPEQIQQGRVAQDE